MPIGSPQWMYASGDFTLDQSLKLPDIDSELSWTPTSAGNRRTWTFSAWVKRGKIDSGSTGMYIFGGYKSGDSAELRRLEIRFREDKLYVMTSSVYIYKTTALKFPNIPS